MECKQVENNTEKSESVRRNLTNKQFTFTYNINSKYCKLNNNCIETDETNKFF